MAYNRYDLGSGVPLESEVRGPVQARPSPWDALRTANTIGQRRAFTEAGSLWPSLGLPNPAVASEPTGPQPWAGGQFDQLIAQGINPMTGVSPTPWAAPGVLPDTNVVPTRSSIIDTVSRWGQRINPSPSQFGRVPENVRSGAAAYRRPEGDTTIEKDTLQSAYARRLQAFQEPYKAKLAELEDAYGTRISELQSELAGYRGGLTDVNAAYGEYAEDAEAILKQAAQVEADMLGPTAVEEEVERTYDEHEGTMQETLARIDSSGNTELAGAMSEEVARTEEMMVDGLRSDLMTQDEMHRLAGAQAQALANMAWKDDAYNAERTRYDLEAQINTAIAAKQDQIQTTRDEMTAAMTSVRTQMGQFEMTPDELWTAALNDYGAAAGLNSYEIQELQTMWADLMENPENEANYGSFKSSLQQGINMEAMAQLGWTSKIQALTGLLESTENIEGLQKLDRMMSSMDVKNLIPEIQKWGRMFGYNFETDIPLEEATSIQDVMYSSMLDLWNHYGDYKSNYEAYTSPTANVSAKGASAPSNWVNRYQPEYAHRRDVLAPSFASEFKSTFSGVNPRVGGLGYMRDPNVAGNVGGGRASNSDHQSGGALDLYAGSHEDMLRIEQWASSHPAVSYVIYSGNKDHERHHVHVSLRLGYGYTGA